MQQRFISEKSNFIIKIILATIVLMLIFTRVLWFKVKTIELSFFALTIVFFTYIDIDCTILTNKKR